MIPTSGGREASLGCREIRKLADQVRIETAQCIAAHLERCPSCRAEIDDLRRLRASLRLAFTAAGAEAQRDQDDAQSGPVE